MSIVGCIVVAYPSMVKLKELKALLRLMQQKKYRKAKKVVLDISPYIEGMTIDDLAVGIGIHPRSASTLKKGTVKGDWKTLINCSRFLNVPIEKLLVIEEEN